MPHTALPCLPAPARGLFAALGLTLAVAAPAQANQTYDPFIDPPFSVAADGFNTLIAARISTAQLVAGFGGNVALPVTSGGGIFRRTTGTAYAASYGLYEWGGPRSTFEYSVANAADDVSSIVFQTFMNVSLSDGVNGILAPANLPTLSINGGQQFLQATTQVLQSVASIDGLTGVPSPASPNNPNYATFTWDLSSFGAAVESFSLVWATDAHTSTLAFQVDQIGAVPEPETAALALAALCGIAGARWWPRRRQREQDRAA